MLKTWWMGALILVACTCVFMAGFTFPRPQAPAPEHHVFSCDRSRLWVGDESTEVEVFRDPAGQWVACVYQRGRLFRGKLQLVRRGE